MGVVLSVNNTCFGLQTALAYLNYLITYFLMMNEEGPRDLDPPLNVLSFCPECIKYLYLYGVGPFCNMMLEIVP